MRSSAWHLIGHALFAIGLAWAVSGAGRTVQAQPAPETQSGRRDSPAATAAKYMVATANPIATEAARDILRRGGSAVDAAIAAQLVLGLVEPQSSGLGGGAFLLHFDALQRGLRSYDGRETAPAEAREDRFLDRGQPIPFPKAAKSALSIGVPGTVRLIELAHRNHGKLKWVELFGPAIALATRGFPVSPRLHKLLGDAGRASFAPDAQRYFYTTDGKPWPVGHLLKNADYAASLERISAEGADAFYSGPIAEAVARGAADVPEGAGRITLADLASYKALERPVVCAPYRAHRVCGMGPPSSAGHTIGQALMMLDGFPLASGPGARMAPDAMHLMAEATKLAFADRNRYLADADFVPPPRGMLDREYLADRRKLIAPFQVTGEPTAGRPPETSANWLGDDQSNEASGTSHISIVDAMGNAVAMTTTIESMFGSGRWAAGFLLNNELTDFSMRPADRDGRPIANRLQGGKRPRSSMAPTIVLDGRGEPVIVTGSAGGARIIPYVIKTVVALIDWKTDAATAVALANFGGRGSTFELEAPSASWFAGPAHPAGALSIVTRALGVMSHGHRIALETLTSGTQVVVRRSDGMLEGAADPRREGSAAGD